MVIAFATASSGSSGARSGAGTIASFKMSPFREAPCGRCRRPQGPRECPADTRERRQPAGADRKAMGSRLHLRRPSAGFRWPYCSSRCDDAHAPSSPSLSPSSQISSSSGSSFSARRSRMCFSWSSTLSYASSSSRSVIASRTLQKPRREAEPCSSRSHHPVQRRSRRWYALAFLRRLGNAVEMVVIGDIAEEPGCVLMDHLQSAALDRCQRG